MSGGDTRSVQQRSTLKKALKDYSTETTLHGIKFIGEEDRLSARRLTWIIIVITATVVMSYFIATKLMLYYKYPTAINLDVQYVPHLEFPAVAVCNQNPYRITALQESGLYDVVTTTYKRGQQRDFLASDSASEKEDYMLLEEICSIPNHVVFREEINNVPRSVCRHLCTNLRSMECSGFLYRSERRGCILTSYTGSPEESGRARNITCGGADTFYRRLRSLPSQPTTCSFEAGEKHCNLYAATEDTVFGQEWELVQGSKVHPPVMDHTFAKVSAHLLAMVPTVGRMVVQAKRRIPHMDTTDKCLQLFYVHLGYGTSALQIGVVYENMTQDVLLKILVSKDTFLQHAWKPVFVTLPPGINMILLQAERTGQDVSGIGVDDLRILPCHEFERNVVFTPSGSEYMGTTNTTAAGEQCLPWADVPEFYRGREDMFPDGSPEEAQNYCRNIDGRLSGPWCVTENDGEEHCAVPYPEDCEPDFRCLSSGRCVPLPFTCDGENHCEDGSDERVPCSTETTLACHFEEPFICGYTIYPSSAGFMWERVVDQTWSEQLLAGVQKTRYVMRVTNAPGTKVGDIATLKSREYTFDKESLLSFYVKMKVDPNDFETKLNVRLMSPLGAFSEDLVTIRQRDDDIWVKYYLCVPRGTFTLTFHAVLGPTRPSQLILALDAVQVISGATRPSPVQYEQIIEYQSLDYESEAFEPDDFEDGTSWDTEIIHVFESFKEYVNQKDVIAAIHKCDIKEIPDDRDYDNGIYCIFDGLGQCGFTSRQESTFYDWKLIPKEFVEEAAKDPYVARGCGGDYYYKEDTIETPGYPVAYDNNMLCKYNIRLPARSFVLMVIPFGELEPSPSGCPFDNITISDKFGSHTLCQRVLHTLEPQFSFPGEIVSVEFKSDNLFTRKGYQIKYRSGSGTLIDFVIAAANHGEYNVREYRSQLSSPPFVLRQTSCLVFELIAWERLRVVLAERLEEETSQIELLDITKHIGPAWHRAFITLSANEEDRGRPRHIVFHTYHPQPEASFTAALDKIQLLPGSCRDIDFVGRSVNCTFTDMNQCGYLDISDGPERWMRAYDQGGGYSMAVFFTEHHRISVKLLSPLLSVTNNTCLLMDIEMEGDYVTLFVGTYAPEEESVTKLTVFKRTHIQNGQAKVLLPDGRFRLVFGATGKCSFGEKGSSVCQVSSVRLRAITLVSNIDCASTGSLPRSQNVSAPQLETHKTGLPQERRRADSLAHPVSGLSSAEIENITYNHLLDEIDIPLEDFVTRHAPSEDDMILQCRWNGKRCLSSYLVSQNTDMGQCVVFNSFADEADRLTVSKSGAAHGLELIVNVAGYEYVEGLFIDSGIKVELFHQSEYPNIRNTGFIVGPGVHSIVKVDYTKSKHLPRPYGKCGSKELSHYPDIYSFSTCRRDCEATKLEKRCDCRDVYMPESEFATCSTKQYLNCVVEEDVGNQTEFQCDPCPASCESNEYDVQISYAAITGSNVDMLLAERKDKVITDFHAAKEVANRVGTKYVFSVLNALRTILLDLARVRGFLTYNVLQPNTSTFSRVEIQMEKINYGTQKDGVNLYKNVYLWHMSFLTVLQDSRDALRDRIEQGDNLLKYLGEMLLWQTGKIRQPLSSRHKYETMLSFFSDASVSLEGVATALKDFITYYGSISRVDPYQIAEVNVSLIPASLRYKRNHAACESLATTFQSTSDLVMGQLFVFSERLRQAVDSNYSSSQPPPLINDLLSTEDVYQTRSHTSLLRETSRELNNCLSEYGDFVDDIVNEIISKQFLFFRSSDKLEGYDQMRELDQHIRWFQNLYSMYVHGSMDMLDLTKAFDSAHERGAVIALESIYSRIQQALSTPLKADISEMENRMIEYYMERLKGLAKLSSYFEGKAPDLLNPARRIGLWRRPFPRFNDPDIRTLDYHLDEEEAALTVPLNFVHYIDTVAARDVKTYLSEYFATLEDVIDETDARVLSMIKEVQTSIETLDNLLASFKKKTEVGEEFVKANILKMDIYFPELKRSFIEQQKAYDLAAFFGDMGGYMGLLLGASVLTFLEIVDFLLVFCSQRKQPRDQSENDVKKADLGVRVDGDDFRHSNEMDQTKF